VLNWLFGVNVGIKLGVKDKVTQCLIQSASP